MVWHPNMTAPAMIDLIDRRILAILHDDASRPILEIADAVGLSNNACWRRIKALEQKGVIRRRTISIGLERLGLGLTAFVTLRTDRHSADWLEAFADIIRTTTEVVECHRLSGQADYLLKIVVSDIGHYDRVYQRLVRAIPGLTDVSSTFSMEQMKAGSGLEPSALR